MDIEEAICERRSIRKFSDAVVDRPLIEKIISASLWAPSGGNAQPWKIVIATGKTRNEIAKIVAGATSRPYRQVMEEELAGKGEIINSVTRFYSDLGGAPVVILVFVPRRPVPHLESSFDRQRWDIGRIVDFQGSAALMQNLCLTAHGLGLGTCWMTSPKWVEEKILSYLYLKDLELAALTPIGYPAEKPRKPKRKPKQVIWLE